MTKLQESPAVQGPANIMGFESPTQKTSKQIAFSLIGIYGFLLAAVGIVAVLDEDTAGWLDLFKSGFLILGGALSTVVGYYFGSRGTQEAEQHAHEQQKRADWAIKELDNERDRANAAEKELKKIEIDDQAPLESEVLGLDPDTDIVSPDADLQLQDG